MCQQWLDHEWRECVRLPDPQRPHVHHVTLRCEECGRVRQDTEYLRLVQVYEHEARELTLSAR